MQGILYLIRNKINNKCYIGKTYRELNIRFKEHISDSKRGVERPLCRALRKYGTDNFEVLEIGNYPEELLEEKEIEAINRFDSFRNGYNATLGGEGTRNIKYSDAEIINEYNNSGSLTKTAIILGIDPLTCRTALIRNKITPKSSGTISRSKSKQIICIDTNQLFNNSYECAEFLIDCGIADTNDTNNVSRSIQRVCNGDRNSYKKLKFSYT